MARSLWAATPLTKTVSSATRGLISAHVLSNEETKDSEECTRALHPHKNSIRCVLPVPPPLMTSLPAHHLQTHTQSFKIWLRSEELSGASRLSAQHHKEGALRLELGCNWMDCSMNPQAISERKIPQISFRLALLRWHRTFLSQPCYSGIASSQWRRIASSTACICRDQVVRTARAQAERRMRVRFLSQSPFF